jgi:hypothetical protein
MIPDADVRAQIVGEIYKVLERLDADEELLAIDDSWRDTFDDAEALTMLRDYNAGRPHCASGNEGKVRLAALVEPLHRNPDRHRVDCVAMRPEGQVCSRRGRPAAPSLR